MFCSSYPLPCIGVSTRLNDSTGLGVSNTTTFSMLSAFTVSLLAIITLWLYSRSRSGLDVAIDEALLGCGGRIGWIEKHYGGGNSSRLFWFL
ncbi:unnamed protein product [Malus baccata var. baccata]